MYSQGHKTVSVGEILALSGATAYSKSVGFDPKKVFILNGDAISDKDLKKALEDLSRK